MKTSKNIILTTLLVVSTMFLSACNPFAQKKAGLQVMTNDIPTSVFLVGQYIEKTPYIGKELQPGTYLLKIQPDDPNLTSYETTINLRGGLLSVVIWKPGTRPETSGGVIYEMEKLSSSKKSELSIISIPDEAIISVDGQTKEFTPLLIGDVSPGHHEFEISLPSYETQKHTINVIGGHRMDVTVKLAKESPTATEETTIEETPEASDSAQIATESATTTKATPAPIRQAKTSTSSATIKIESTGYLVDGKEVLRVRDSAGAAGKELGFANVGEKYPYLDEKDNGWFKIDFDGTTGWVSGQYATLVE